jgi:hypothetical protein
MKTMLRCLRKIELLIVLSVVCGFVCESAFAQQNNVVIQPDVSFNFGPLTTTGTVQYPVSTSDVSVKYWRFSYQSTGFSGLSIELDCAPDSSGAPGTFVACPGTVTDGANPQTSTTGGITTITVNATTANPWVQINLASTTGTGAIRGRVYGYRINPAGGGGGCTSPCTVIGPDTPGTAPTQNPVEDSGFDGTNVRRFLTDTSGRAIVTLANGTATVCPSQALFNFSTSGNAQLVAASGTNRILICHYDVAFASGTDFKLTYGTGSNCAMGTTDLTGLKKNILTDAEDYGPFAPLTVPAGNALCGDPVSSVAGGLTVIYAQIP